MKTKFVPTLLLFCIVTNTALSQTEIPLVPNISIPHPKILSFRDPSALTPHQDLEIVPGLTQRLLIELRGESEMISFDFRVNGTDPFLFEIFVMINSELEKKSYLAKFAEAETLIISIDHQAQKCYIRGDKGFSLTSPLAEGDYKIKIIQKRGLENEEPALQDVRYETIDRTRSSSVIVTGFTIGSLVIAVVGAKMMMKARVKRNAFEARKLVLNDKMGAEEEKDCESNGSSQVIVTPTKKETTGHNLPNSPSGSVSSETSISSYRIFKFDAEDTNQTHYQKQEDRLQKKANNFVQEEKETNSAEEKQEDPTAISLALDFDGMNSGSLAEKEIRALVRKLEEEGALGNDCDPSVESDDEDQYEAPQLPDYFCCLVCLHGKRSTLAKPCQHIFACVKCINEVIDSRQACVLCSGEVSGYESW